MTFRSPCARSPRIDRLVHVQLAASLEPHHADVAGALRQTSPHYANTDADARPWRLHPAIAWALAKLVGRGAILTERLRGAAR